MVCTPFSLVILSTFGLKIAQQKCRYLCILPSVLGPSTIAKNWWYHKPTHYYIHNRCLVKLAWENYFNYLVGIVHTAGNQINQDRCESHFNCVWKCVCCVHQHYIRACKSEKSCPIILSINIANPTNKIL